MADAATNLQPPTPASGGAPTTAGVPAASARSAQPKRAARPDYKPGPVYGSTTGSTIATPGAPEAAPAAAAAAPVPEGVERPVLGHGGAVPPERIVERVERERRKFLRDEYGTEDPTKIREIKTQRAKERDELAAQRDELTQLRAAEEERKRSAMSENERVQQDLQRAKEREAQLLQQIADMKRDVAFKEQDAVVNGSAAKYVAPELLEDALARFGRYVRSLKKIEIERMTPRAVERWFEKLAKDVPAFALPKDAPAPEPKKPEPAPVRVPKRVAISTSRDAARGKPTPKPATESGALDRTGGKTVRPGQKDSMSKAELREFLKAKGMRGW